MVTNTHPAVDEYNALRERLTLDLIPEATRGEKAVDVACGVGRFSRGLAAKGYDVFGFDADPSRIEVARGDVTVESVEFETAAIERLFTLERGTFDLALALEIIEHLRDDKELLRGIHHALRAGGTLILSTPNRLSMEACGGTLRQLLTGDIWNGWDPTHRHIYRLTELRKLLRAVGFRVVRSRAFHFGARSCGEPLRRMAESLAGGLPGLPAHSDAWPLNRLGYKLVVAAVRDVGS